MRKTMIMILAMLLLCCAVALLSVSAQAKEGQEKKPGSAVAKEAKEEGPQEYLRIMASELERAPEKFRDLYVGVADVFGRGVPAPRSLRRYDISNRTHVAFLTQPALGSNALCVVSRDNKEGMATLKTVIEESPIYIEGRVGPKIQVGSGLRTLFVVDRVVRGDQPPPPRKVGKKKSPVVMIREVPVLDNQGQPRIGPDRRIVKQQVGRYTIRKPSTRYAIPDPYDKTRIIYVTLKF